jgi:hypothetical protein
LRASKAANEVDAVKIAAKWLAERVKHSVSAFLDIADGLDRPRKMAVKHLQ